MYTDRLSQSVSSQRQNISKYYEYTFTSNLLILNMFRSSLDHPQGLLRQRICKTLMNY